MVLTNREILLASRPVGMPTEENFSLVENPVPNISEGEVLIKTLYLSVDPYMRGRMRGVRTYVDPFEIGKPLTGGVVGKVIESSHPNFKAGEIVEGRLNWADYSTSDGSNIRKVDPSIAPISTAIGAVGMPGLTAYFGLLYIGKPNEGETVVVSGAAGAVGTIVGQIAKIKGCRVVGIAGSDEKCQYLVNELGFDVAINYKTENVLDSLKNACPNGIDVYFDNVGGEISDSVMSLINYKSRTVLCGQIAQYNDVQPKLGPRILGQLIQRSSMMQGFIVGDFKEKNDEGYSQLGKWVQSGKIKYHENIVDGLENAPKAFIGLFKGENIGKQIVKVSEE